MSNSESGTTVYRRVAGPGINMPVEEVMKNVAMYSDLINDRSRKANPFLQTVCVERGQ